MIYRGYKNNSDGFDGSTGPLSRKIPLEAASFDEQFPEIYTKMLSEKVRLKHGRNYDMLMPVIIAGD